MTPEKREEIKSKAEEELRKAWEEEKRQMDADESERQKQLQEIREYKARGNRTQEEYEKHMEESRRAAQGGLPFEVYRGIEIYRIEKKTRTSGTYYNYKFKVMDRGYGTTDLNGAHEMIDREMDLQPTVEEQLTYVKSSNTATKESLTTESQVSSSERVRTDRLHDLQMNQLGQSSNKGQTRQDDRGFPGHDLNPRFAAQRERAPISLTPRSKERDPIGLGIANSQKLGIRTINERLLQGNIQRSENPMYDQRRDRAQLGVPRGSQPQQNLQRHTPQEEQPSILRQEDRQVPQKGRVTRIDQRSRRQRQQDDKVI